MTHLDSRTVSENLSDFYRNYFAENLAQRVSTTLVGDERLAVSSCLLRKRQEVTELLNALKLQGEDLESTLSALGMHRAELKEKVQHMKSDWQRFDNFLKDNEAKRCRAMRKVSRERELISQKQADLVALQEEIKSLTKERDQLARRVKKNGIYSKYMDSVVQASGQFQNAHQVMSRYDSLKRMRKELLQRTLQMQDSIERTRAQLTHITEQDNNTMLYHNNTLARLRSKLDKAQAECMVWESKWAHVQNTAAQKTLLLGTIKMAILNIYQMVCKRAKGTGEVPIAPEDALKLLNKIQTCLSDLISICEEVKRLPSFKVI